MLINEIFEEREQDGILLRRSKVYPKLWVSADGRVVGIRGTWLNPRGRETHGQTRYYVATAVEKKHKDVGVHRLVAECWIINLNPGLYGFVDHVRGTEEGNTTLNLMWTDNRSNCLNRRSHRAKSGSSSMKGVYYHQKRQRFVARIQIAGVNQQLGWYKEEADAGRAYDIALMGIDRLPVNFPLKSYAND